MPVDLTTAESNANFKVLLLGVSSLHRCKLHYFQIAYV